jgi:hypothetical protein
MSESAIVIAIFQITAYFQDNMIRTNRTKNVRHKKNTFSSMFN